MPFDKNGTDNKDFVAEAGAKFSDTLNSYGKSESQKINWAISSVTDEVTAIDTMVEYIACIESAIKIIDSAHETYKANTTTSKESFLRGTTIISPIPEKDEEIRDIIQSITVDGESRTPTSAINVIGAGITPSTGKVTQDFHSAQQTSQTALKTAYLNSLSEAESLLNSIGSVTRSPTPPSLTTSKAPASIASMVKSSHTSTNLSSTNNAATIQKHNTAPASSSSPSSTISSFTPTSGGGGGAPARNSGSSSGAAIGRSLLRGGGFTSSGDRERSRNRSRTRDRSRRRGRSRSSDDEAALPAEGVFSSPYGPRWGKFHYGIDIAAPIGTPIYAVKGGEVIDSGPAQGYGNWIRIRHDDGSVSVYGHMPAEMLYVQVGDRVETGDEIAGMGSEGQSTGSHLHFQIHPDGETPVDPVPWLEEHGVSMSG